MIRRNLETSLKVAIELKSSERKQRNNSIWCAIIGKIRLNVLNGTFSHTNNFQFQDVSCPIRSHVLTNVKNEMYFLPLICSYWHHLIGFNGPVSQTISQVKHYIMWKYLLITTKSQFQHQISSPNVKKW